MAGLYMVSGERGLPDRPAFEPTAAELLGALRTFLFKLHSDQAAEADFPAGARRLLERLQDRLQIRIRLSVARDWPREMPPALAACLYRVLEEAVNSARLHGRADDITIRLEAASSSRLELLVSDNGNLDGTDGRFRGAGMLGLSDRVRALGGELAVEPQRGHRRHVRIAFPHPSAAA